MFVKKLGMGMMSGLLLQLRRAVSIEMMKTPNPNFLKFVPIGHKVLGGEGTLDISSVEYSSVSPLAQDLFKIEGVTRVFYGADYLSIAKQDDIDWEALKPEIFKLLETHFEEKKPILVDNAALESDEIDPNDPEVVQFIKQIIASRIRPNVQEDGGDVRFVSFNDETGLLTLRLVGACAGCPSSSATLKGGIEKMLTYYVPQIKEVIAEDE